MSPDGCYRNEIDYFRTNKGYKFFDCRVINHINFNSNHRMVRAKLQLKISKGNRPFKAKHLSKVGLEPPGKLKENLDTFIENTITLNTQQKYNKFEELISKKNVNKTKNERNNLQWLRDETKELPKSRA